jgi:hypothetical protein
MYKLVKEISKIENETLYTINRDNIPSIGERIYLIWESKTFRVIDIERSIYLSTGSEEILVFVEEI